jgi:hypothetical protein
MSKIPGMMYPTMQGMEAGNPRDAAIANMNNAATIQAHANNAVGGRKKRMRSRKGGSGTIAVPQFNMLYQPQGGPGTNPNDQIASNAQVATQGAANSALDAGAFKKGGSGSDRKKSRSRRRSRKGGNPDWVWGCMSGGRKRNRTSKKRKGSRKRSSKKY